MPRTLQHDRAEYPVVTALLWSSFSPPTLLLDLAISLGHRIARTPPSQRLAH